MYLSAAHLCAREDLRRIQATFRGKSKESMRAPTRTLFLHICQHIPVHSLPDSAHTHTHTRKLTHICAQYKAGDPMDTATLMGPLISEDEAKRVEAWVSSAKGALLCGGKRNGSFFGMRAMNSERAQYTLPLAHPNTSPTHTHAHTCFANSPITLFLSPLPRRNRDGRCQ